MQKKVFLCAVALTMMVFCFTVPAVAGPGTLSVSMPSISAQNTDTDDGGGSCAAAYLLGDSDPRLDILRSFRDRILLSIPAGRSAVECYYEKSEAFISICESSPVVKYTAAGMLEAVVPVIKIMLRTEQ